MTLGSHRIGERAEISLYKEDKWIYPRITLHTGQGEQAEFSLQHMPSKELAALGIWFVQMSEKVKVK